MTIDKETKAVVIGLWRQGNKYEIISHLTELSVYEVDKIISEYQKELKKT